MLTAGIRTLTGFPPRRLHLGRWTPGRLLAARTGAAVTGAGDVTWDEFAWGHAVRREWPDGRHDLFGFTPDVDTARRRLARDEGFWRRGPARSTAVYLVAANAAAVAGHPVDGCRGLSCPDAPQRRQR